MFLKRLELFSLFGFRVSLDLSWVFLAVLVTWTLATGYFPDTLPDQSTATYYWMGVAGAIGLFVSIILHEFAHALVARRYDLAISGITLFIFGGVAEMTEEPKSPIAEFMMAIAGPILSFALAAVFYLFEAGTQTALASPQFSAVLSYLALINFVLAVFNLLPAFPLDGGRIFRSIAWWWTGSLTRATRISSRLGRLFAGAFIALGLLNLISGNTIGGIWLMLIGFFVYNAAGSSRMQMAAATLLKGVPLARVMRSDPASVPADISIETLVEGYFYKLNHRFFPVVDDGDLKGCIRLDQARDIDRSQWRTTRVSDVMTPLSETNILDAGYDTRAALQKMMAGSATHYIVTSNSRLVGVVTPKDIMAYLAIHLELEADAVDGLSRARGST
jgi:Zn-dependent protease/predicted transcriptional regulator